MKKTFLNYGYTKYETSKDNLRRVSHIISDAIFQRITGEGGFFDTRIVYVAETGPKDNRQKRLAIMDQDQANHRFLTDGSYLVLTPRFSPNSQKITFMSYVKANSPNIIFIIQPFEMRRSVSSIFLNPLTR
mgnify:CR=1 FL=1